MVLTGTVLELLLPGLIAELAAVLILGALGIVDSTLFTQQSSALTALAALTSAYFVGIAVRQLDWSVYAMHLMQRPGTIAVNRLNERWLMPALWIIERMNYSDLISNLPRTVLNADQARAKLSDDKGNELIANLGDYLLATQQTAWSQNLLYHSNLGRLARNSVGSLVVLPVACVLSTGAQLRPGCVSKRSVELAVRHPSGEEPKCIACDNKTSAHSRSFGDGYGAITRPYTTVRTTRDRWARPAPAVWRQSDPKMRRWGANEAQLAAKPRLCHHGGAGRS